jgi:hypothetical protein
MIKSEKSPVSSNWRYISTETAAILLLKEALGF